MTDRYRFRHIRRPNAMGNYAPNKKRQGHLDPTTMTQLAVRIDKTLHKAIKVAVVEREETISEFAAKALKAELIRGAPR